VFDDPDWPTEKISLSAGDRLFLYTDGVVEGKIATGNGDILDLPEILLGITNLSLEEQVSKLMTEAAYHTKDDATIVAFEVL
jgi:serine phosphatase RsbU (regulator of sigma subunit)